MMKRPLCTVDTDEILLSHCVCVCVSECLSVCVCVVGSFSDTPPPLQWNVADDDDVISCSLKFSDQGGLIDEIGQSAGLQ